ncbi:MAG TPA: zinc ABC transporter permease AztB [Acidimicrobiia bacterium]|nr:zinc ABC transporter permease AztB [Acidimicrobiia bacterium]
MDWLIDPLSEPFMQRVLVGSALAVMTASLIGTWVVLRGLSFMGDALAHGVTPGIALAFALGFNLTVGAIGAAVAMTLGISLVHRKARLREDTGIGLLFVGMLALGVIIMSRLPSFSSSLATILFGDTLGIRREDIMLQAAAAAVTLAVILIFYRAFLVLSFNEEKAEMLGLRPGLAHLVMLSLLTLAIVTSFRTVGTLLVFALIVAPPATASLVVRRVPTMMAAAVAFGFLAVVSGLLISWHADTAAGATMAGISVAIFFVVLALRDLLNRRRPLSAEY